MSGYGIFPCIQNFAIILANRMFFRQLFILLASVSLFFAFSADITCRLCGNTLATKDAQYDPKVDIPHLRNSEDGEENRGEAGRSLHSYDFLPFSMKSSPLSRTDPKDTAALPFVPVAITETAPGAKTKDSPIFNHDHSSQKELTCAKCGQSVGWYFSTLELKATSLDGEKPIDRLLDDSLHHIDISSATTLKDDATTATVGETAVKTAVKTELSTPTRTTHREMLKPGTELEQFAARPLSLPDFPDVVSEIKSQCLYFAKDWWHYEVCTNSRIRQFHREDDGSITSESHLGSVVFGKSVFRRDIPHPAGYYASELFANGDFCEEEKVHRATEVQYWCCRQKEHPHSTYYPFVFSVLEEKTCVYLIKICSMDVCLSDPALPDPDDSSEDGEASKIASPNKVSDRKAKTRSNSPFSKNSAKTNKKRTVQLTTKGAAPTQSPPSSIELVAVEKAAAPSEQKVIADSNTGQPQQRRESYYCLRKDAILYTDEELYYEITDHPLLLGPGVVKFM